MPANDLFHDAVKTALIKDGWLITADPLPITVGGVDFYIDLGAEKLIAAERGNEKIAIEIKSFLSNSIISEFHAALGQFLNYQLALQETQPDRQLYLAVADDIYQYFLSKPFIQSALRKYQVATLVFDPETEEVMAWIRH